MTQELMSLSQVGEKRTGRHAGGKPQKYVLDEPSRRLVQAVYANPAYGNVSESIDYLERKLGVPRQIIKRWGQQLGLSRTKEKPWSPEELAYLQQYYQQPTGERASLRHIAQHLGRTRTAVHIKAKRMKFRRTTGDDYTVHALADALGCDWHKVEHWIQRGWLRAHREKSRDDGRYSIFAQSIRRFIIAYPAEIDHRRADWIFLLDILVGSEDIGKVKN